MCIVHYVTDHADGDQSAQSLRLCHKKKINEGKERKFKHRVWRTRLVHGWLCVPLRDLSLAQLLISMYTAHFLSLLVRLWNRKPLTIFYVQLVNANDLTFRDSLIQQTTTSRNTTDFYSLHWGYSSLPVFSRSFHPIRESGSGKPFPVSRGHFFQTHVDLLAGQAEVVGSTISSSLVTPHRYIFTYVHTSIYISTPTHTFYAFTYI